MINKLFQKGLNEIYNRFKTNTASMLIVTGTIGWGLSSLAQVTAVLFNPKISREQKGYLVPQELADAVVNISAFFLITQATEKLISKLISTGKFTTSDVRKFLEINKEKYGDKVGKHTFNLDKVLSTEPKFPKESYYGFKNHATTIGTIGASIFSSNIVTPIVRNYTASNMQKKYLDNRPQSPNNMKI